jgi:hypothetical protein
MLKSSIQIVTHRGPDDEKFDGSILKYLIKLLPINPALIVRNINAQNPVNIGAEDVLKLQVLKLGKWLISVVGEFMELVPSGINYIK